MSNNFCEIKKYLEENVDYTNVFENYDEIYSYYKNFYAKNSLANIQLNFYLDIFNFFWKKRELTYFRKENLETSFSLLKQSIKENVNNIDVFITKRDSLEKINRTGAFKGIVYDAYLLPGNSLAISSDFISYETKDDYLMISLVNYLFFTNVVDRKIVDFGHRNVGMILKNSSFVNCSDIIENEYAIQYMKNDIIQLVKDDFMRIAEIETSSIIPKRNYYKTKVK